MRRELRRERSSSCSSQRVHVQHSMSSLITGASTREHDAAGREDEAGPRRGGLSRSRDAALALSQFAAFVSVGIGEGPGPNQTQALKEGAVRSARAPSCEHPDLEG
jgi:hypothetical protein